MDVPKATRRQLVALGGVSAILISLALLLIVIARRTSTLNVVTGWTVVLCGVGGVVALRAVRRTGVAAAATLILVGATPALIGGLGLLYLFSVCLIVAGLPARR